MQLGNVSFDATMERSQNYSSDVPTYPVEKGFKISDAVLKNPLEINLKAVISEMPLTFGYSYGAYGRFRSVDQVVNELLNMYYAAEPVSLYTNFGDYHSLVIQSITIPETTEMVNAVEVSITLKQVRITGNYEVDYKYEGETGVPAGRQSTSGYNREGWRLYEDEEVSVYFNDSAPMDERKYTYYTDEGVYYFVFKTYREGDNETVYGHRVRGISPN